MSINDTEETISKESQGKSDSGFLGILHTIALIGVIAGAVGSVGLTLYAGRSTPRFLLVLFVIWVLSPFVALAWANLSFKALVGSNPGDALLRDAHYRAGLPGHLWESCFAACGVAACFRVPCSSIGVMVAYGDSGSNSRGHFTQAITSRRRRLAPYSTTVRRTVRKQCASRQAASSAGAPELLLFLPIVIIIVVGVVLFLVGFHRVEQPRIPSFEGIEDPQTTQAYDQISRWPQFRMLRLMIDRKLAGYCPAGTLADIGCGPGYLTTLIAQRHPHLQVLGLDTSDEMVKAASLNAADLGLSSRVKFRRGDAANLPLPDGALDFAVSTLSLHHWSHPENGLAEIHRALKTGGQLLLFDLRRDPRRFFIWVMRFAQRIVVPAPLRLANEPLGSLQSSYSLTELEVMMSKSHFEEYTIDGRTGWVFVWARKTSQ